MCAAIESFVIKITEFDALKKISHLRNNNSKPDNISRVSQLIIFFSLKHKIRSSTSVKAHVWENNTLIRYSSFWIQFNFPYAYTHLFPNQICSTFFPRVRWLFLYNNHNHCATPYSSSQLMWDLWENRPPPVFAANSSKLECQITRILEDEKKNAIYTDEYDYGIR